MTKVEAIIQPAKLEAVKRALHEIGVEGMTGLDARGHGRQKGHTEVYRGREYTVDLIPKVKVEMVLADSMVDKVVQTIADTARTGKIGDGKIFLTRIDDAIRIRNDERGSTRCSCMVEGPPPFFKTSASRPLPSIVPPVSTPERRPRNSMSSLCSPETRRRR
jgi:nitrogen regulatory protein P-II 1